MRPWKRLIRSAPAQRAGCWLIQLYIRLVYRTSRWTVERDAATERLLAQKQPFIGTFWHGRMLMIPMIWARRAPLHMLISSHRDGRLIAGRRRLFRHRLGGGLDERRRRRGDAAHAQIHPRQRVCRHHP